MSKAIKDLIGEASSDEWKRVLQKGIDKVIDTPATGIDRLQAGEKEKTAAIIELLTSLQRRLERMERRAIETEKKREEREKENERKRKERERENERKREESEKKLLDKLVALFDIKAGGGIVDRATIVGRTTARPLVDMSNKQKQLAEQAKRGSKNAAQS